MKLEVGKMYITRDGQKVGPDERTNSIDYPWNVPWKTGPFMYTEDGIGCLGDPNDNIIAEYTDDDTIQVTSIEPLSTDAFRRIIEMLNGSVDAALDDLNFDDAIEYAVMMRECERMMRDG